MWKLKINEREKENIGRYEQLVRATNLHTQITPGYVRWSCQQRARVTLALTFSCMLLYLLVSLILCPSIPSRVPLPARWRSGWGLWSLWSVALFWLGFFFVFWMLKKGIIIFTKVICFCCSGFPFSLLKVFLLFRSPWRNPHQQDWELDGDVGPSPRPWDPIDLLSELVEPFCPFLAASPSEKQQRKR